jgi:peptidylprolyl isomerase
MPPHQGELHMKKSVRSFWGLAALGLALMPAGAFANDWVAIAPENTLYLELSKGLVIIELQSAAAPGHVARIKKLASSGFYDGTVFHRVIEGFMAQGGDPTGTGTGGSNEPDLKAEFTFHRPSGSVGLGLSDGAQSIGLSGTAVVLTEPEALQFTHPDGLLQSWVPHCRGVASMARAQDPNSANSQFFIMFANNTRSLDRQYTPWGRVVHGMDVVDRLARGEPPRQPDKIVRARVGSDVPAKERIALEELTPNAPAMQEIIKTASRMGRGAIDPCAVQVPVRVAKEGP